MNIMGLVIMRCVKRIMPDPLVGSIGKPVSLLFFWII